MDKWTMIIMEMEDMWHNSVEYRVVPSSYTAKEYRIERDIYKAQRIYDLYGYDYFMRFLQQCPHIIEFMDNYVPCKKQGPHQNQCTMFCHRYNLEKGCTLKCRRTNGLRELC